MERIDAQIKSSGLCGTITSPSANEHVYDQCIAVTGWIQGEEILRQGAERVRAYLGGVCIGETRIFIRESPGANRLGFKILARTSEPLIASRSAAISILAWCTDQNAAHKIGDVAVQLVPARLVERHYGGLVPPDQRKVLHRDDIYGSGPPVDQASPEALQLLIGYLPERSSVVDVGCGAGAYGPALMQAGHQWLGLEVNDHCLQLLARRGLPVRKIEGATTQFPCFDREFDHAICIEVLEHVDEPELFLMEIARVIRGRAMFSVPNIEVLPYFRDWEVVPWHLLEAGHKNFFTRTSLRGLLLKYFERVEVFSYGEHRLRSGDQVRLHLHLFAVADLSEASTADSTGRASFRGAHP